MSLEEVEAFLIKKALARYDGNVSRAAEALGLLAQRPLPPAAAVRALARQRAPMTSRRGGDACRTTVRVLLLALAAGLARRCARRCRCSGAATYAPTRAVDARRADRRASGWLAFASAAREARGPPAADALEPAGGAARGGLLASARAAPARDDALGEVHARGERARRRRCASSGSARSRPRRCCAR